MGRSMLSIQIRETQITRLTPCMDINKLQGPAKRANPRAAVWIDWIEMKGHITANSVQVEDILFPGMPTEEKSLHLG